MRIVENSQSRLVLRDRTSFVSVICCAAALVLAGFALLRGEPRAFGSAMLFLIFAIAFFRSSDVTFDKATRSCNVKRQDMWRLHRTIIPFEAIKNVVVEAMPGNDRPTVTPCRLSLLTRQGEVPLSTSYAPDLDRFQGMRDEVATTVFGLSSPVSSDPVRGLVEAGRSIDAIAFLRRRDGLGLNEAKERVEMLQREVRSERS